MATTTKETTTMNTIKDGTIKGIKLTIGDYVTFGDGDVHHIRGNGNLPQLYYDAEMTAEYQEAERIYRTAERVLTVESMEIVI
jgi:hypothetical protein